MTHKEICTYELCKLAKEKGFDVPTHYAYNDNCRKAMYMELCLNRNTKDSRSISAPSQSLLQRWLREAHAIDIDVYPIFPDGEPCKREYGCQVYAVGKLNKPFRIGYAKTYENILESALKYALENLV